MSNNGGGPVSDRKSLLENGTLSPGVAPLILKPNVSVLIIYAHDSAAHDAAVHALAEFMRDVFRIDVHLDKWDQESIDTSLMDYLSASVLNADKVLVVNSLGAYQRYQAKLAGGQYQIERNEPLPTDQLFLAHIDMALQHHCVVSVRFRYSSFHDVLPPLHGCLQYVVPDNLVPLISAVVGQNMKQDKRFHGFNPEFERLQEAISRMELLMKNDAEWFSKTHYRRKIRQERSIRCKAPLTVVDGLPEEHPGVAILPVEDKRLLTLSTHSEDEDVHVDDRIFAEPPRYFDVSAPESGVFDDASLGADGTSNGEPAERPEQEPARLTVIPEPSSSSCLDESGVLISSSHPMLPAYAEKEAQSMVPVSKYASRDESNNDSGFLETKSESDLRMISAS
ncbi:Protein Y64G10A.6 [Aphelenchoides avenae]|nr:Protein Y64G10A.6 [Aphelenchus avenae]